MLYYRYIRKLGRYEAGPAITYNPVDWVIHLDFAPIDLKPRIWAFQTRGYRGRCDPIETFRLQMFFFFLVLAPICYPSHPLKKLGRTGKRQISACRKIQL